MKYLIVVPDGSGDDENCVIGEARHRLKYLNIPNINKLASKALVGMVRTIPPGIPPGSDAANFRTHGI